MMSKNIQKIFVKPDDTATFNCPECQVSKNLAVGKFRLNRHMIKVRCTCGISSPVLLDFRKCYRKDSALTGVYQLPASESDNKQSKKSNLTGAYTMQGQTFGNGHIVIINVSCGGVQFTTSGSHTFKVGQEARISFTLDDRKHTEVSKRVIVQTVNDNIIGCKFADNETLEQGLRFYLFP